MRTNGVPGPLLGPSPSSQPHEVESAMSLFMPLKAQKSPEAWASSVPPYTLCTDRAEWLQSDLEKAR